MPATAISTKFATPPRGNVSSILRHNLAAAMGVTFPMLLLLIVPGIGLIVADTDLFWSPLDCLVRGPARHIQGGPVDGFTVGLEHARSNGVRGHLAIHRRSLPSTLYVFALAAVVISQVVAVILAELHEGGMITAAMFTGREVLSRPPQDG